MSKSGVILDLVLLSTAAIVCLKLYHIAEYVDTTKMSKSLLAVKTAKLENRQKFRVTKLEDVRKKTSIQFTRFTISSLIPAVVLMLLHGAVQTFALNCIQRTSLWPILVGTAVCNNNYTVLSCRCFNSDFR